jgi:trans-aconitate methyltransferase
MNFDAKYYERFYVDPQTRATSVAEQRRQARFIAAFTRHLGVPVTRIADIGCGIGTIVQQLGKDFPRAQCRGVEWSQYLCETYGWTHGSVVDFQDDPFDLVVCNDVLGYLNARDCNRAIHNLAKLCQGALYLSVLTTEDLDICDVDHTDMQQKTRTHTWYRKRLDKHFVNVGGGLFLRKPLQVNVWQLEHI